jgi:hypothetical protein
MLQSKPLKNPDLPLQKQSGVYIIHMFHSIPKTHVKAKNELPENSRPTQPFQHLGQASAHRLNSAQGADLERLNEDSSAILSSEFQSQVCMPVDRCHCFRMPDHYFMPPSAVDVSQEGHGFALLKENKSEVQ